jgi:Tfp pilus assembly protein PilW
MTHRLDNETANGFSLLELIIAMTLTLTVTGIATVLLAQALNIRTRTNQNADALADAQRALNIMSREIANAGFNLSGNGIVDDDSVTDANGNSTIRIRSNMNRFDEDFGITAREGIGVNGQDAGEDVKYFIHKAGNTNLLARYDAYAQGGGTTTVLANRLDSLFMHYYPNRVSYSTDGCNVSGASSGEVLPSAAKYLVIAVCVHLNQVGSPGTSGFQPERNVLLVSDVTLRNSDLPVY